MRPYYEKDGQTIYHGDCREVFAALPVGSIDLLITDPPYASGARRDAERQVRGAMLRSMEDADWFSHDTMTSWGFSWFIRSVFTDARRLLRAATHMYVFIDWRQAPNLYGMLEATGYRVNQCLVWRKSHYGMGAYWRNQHENIVFASVGMPAAMLDRGMGSVIDGAAVPSEKRVHPTEKPSVVLNRLIAAVPGDIVLDPFMGSGAVLRAAKDRGRRSIGIEIEERYCEIAARRLDQAVLPFPRADAAKPPVTQGVFPMDD